MEWKGTGHVALKAAPLPRWGELPQGVQRIAAPVIDISSDQEFADLLKMLPVDIAEMVEPRIRETEEIVFSLGQGLEVSYGALRVTLGRVVTESDLKSLDIVGNWRADGRLGIDGALHRLARFTELGNTTNLVKIRVARVLVGVAEPLRNVLRTMKRGLLIIGPPGVGKTTLLRDVIRILQEYHGGQLFVVDTSLEICGEGKRPHPFLRLGHRVQVGHPGRQKEVLDLTIMNGGASIFVVDEMGYRGDIELIVFAAGRAVQPTGTVHGEKLMDVVSESRLRPLLGLSTELDNEVQGAVAGHFGLTIEIHGKGKYRIHPDTDTSVTNLLAGKAPVFFDVQLEIMDAAETAPIRQLDLDWHER